MGTRKEQGRQSKKVKTTTDKKTRIKLYYISLELATIQIPSVTKVTVELVTTSGSC